ncbi:TMEM175 family protein [Streptomyces sp. CA-111067]|jgi:uncharacterized membrane protein|uniref:TMEM175 family protein n=1 Tax=Streptomyces sp. CA-111067 TaxID=3240046 RepID=UPI003D986B2D
MSTMSRTTQEQVDERATGRLFGLADGVFAIAITLLALDLRVPDLGEHPTDHVLRHALADQRGRYLAFLLSFYVIASYWRRHNTEMRTARAGHPALVGRTLPLLLVVCALPFAANLLGTYGGRDGIAIVVYAALNLFAVIALLRIRREVRRHRLSPETGPAADDLELWIDVVALVLALPVGYVFRPHGPVALVVLMFLSGVVGSYTTRRRRRAGIGG